MDDTAKTDARGLKSYQVHELAKAKIGEEIIQGVKDEGCADKVATEESEKLRKALGISADYEEGSHWRKQEERLRESLQTRDGEDGQDDGNQERN
jgi:hypothetical protein